MGEWIDNMALLNSGKFSAQSLASRIQALMEESKTPNPKTLILFSPNAKWVYLYSNCLSLGPASYEEIITAPMRHYQTNAERLSLLFDTAAVSNLVVDGSELVMALSCTGECGTRVSDIFAWNSMGSEASTHNWPYSPGMKDRRMDVRKWSDALDLDEKTLKQVLNEENLLITDRYVKIGRCLGYDNVLLFFDLHSFEDIAVHYPEKLTEYSVITVSSE